MPIPKKIIQVLDSRNISDSKLENIIDTSMGDDTIRYYYPTAKILTVIYSIRLN